MKTPLALRYLLPSLGNVLWISVFLAVIGMGPRMMNIDGDLGRHLTIGRYILAQRQVPLGDLFSHTMTGQPLTPHEWLSQVAFALAERALGLDGVVLLSALVIATAFWLVFRQSARVGGVLAAVLVTLLAMAASSLHWLTRPHLFTFLLLALWIDALEALRCGRLKAWWRLPVLMLLWANLHGAFIAGFVTWALYGIGTAWEAFWRSSRPDVQPSDLQPAPGFWRVFLLGGAASLIITLVNPAGLELWRTSVGYIGTDYLVNHTAEYLSPDFHSASTWPFLIMIGLLVGVYGLGRRHIPARQALLNAAWLVMALYSVRNVPLFAILAAPGLAGLISGWLADHQPQARLLAAWNGLEGRLAAVENSLRGFVWPTVMVGLVALAFSAGAALDASGQGNRFDPKVFPVQAADWLAENPVAGQGFNYFPWGGYLLYRAWPERLVFIDGQTDFYGEALTRQYEQVLTVSSGWQQVLAQYKVSWVLMPPDEALTQALLADPAWQVVYRDATAVLLVNGPQ